MYPQRDQAKLVTTLDDKGPPTGSVYERFAFLIRLIHCKRGFQAGHTGATDLLNTFPVVLKPRKEN